MNQDIVDEFEIMDDYPKEKFFLEKATLKQTNSNLEAQIVNLNSQIKELKLITNQIDKNLIESYKQNQLLNETSETQKEEFLRLKEQLEKK